MGIFLNKKAALELVDELEYKPTDYIIEPFLVVE